MIMQIQDSQTLSTNTDPYSTVTNHSKALPSSTDYETCTILDSGEDILKGYQKIPYYIGFDVKYDLRHKARLVAGGSPFGEELKPVKTLMDEGYHHEVDNNPLCTDEYSAKYISIIGCCIWLIVLRKFDNAYSTSAMSSFNMAPREGHLKAVKRILSYLKTFPKGRVIFDTSYPNHSEYPVEDRSNWKDFYPDAEEEILNNLPMSKGPKVRMTVYVDADHAHDLVTRRSIKGILVMLNNTPIRWVSKRQKTVETSTYGSELVASRIATELIMEVRYMLRSLGVDLEGLALMLGDNMSVVLNTSVPSSVLKKKHNAIAYHCV
jgi:hypothetical protein